jgi:hypothetical protein
MRYGSFAVKKVFVIMAMRWDDRCDLTSHARTGASRAPLAKAQWLGTWRILRKLRCCPWRASQLARAIDVLQLREA